MSRDTNHAVIISPPSDYSPDKSLDRLRDTLPGHLAIHRRNGLNPLRLFCQGP